jgi:hypothetical protein
MSNCSDQGLLCELETFQFYAASIQGHKGFEISGEGEKTNLQSFYQSPAFCDL